MHGIRVSVQQELAITPSYSANSVCRIPTYFCSTGSDIRRHYMSCVMQYSLTSKIPFERLFLK